MSEMLLSEPQIFNRATIQCFDNCSEAICVGVVIAIEVVFQERYHALNQTQSNLVVLEAQFETQSIRQTGYTC